MKLADGRLFPHNLAPPTFGDQRSIVKGRRDDHPPHAYRLSFPFLFDWSFVVCVRKGKEKEIGGA